jgi:nucleotide-binding universal stress UspA family protein
MRANTIVIGYDGSTHAQRALDAAASLVRPDGVVHVVTATHPLSAVEFEALQRSLPEGDRYVVDPDGSDQYILDEAARALDRHGVRHEEHLVADDPATAILDVAEREGAEIVVVGSRGRGAVRRFVRGSVSTRVATHAPMSVFIVHTDD